jgi:hypothetical protein
MKNNIFGIQKTTKIVDITYKDDDALWLLVWDDPSGLKRLLYTDRSKFIKKLNKTYKYTDKQLREVYTTKSSYGQRI